MHRKWELVLRNLLIIGLSQNNQVCETCSLVVLCIYVYQTAKTHSRYLSAVIKPTLVLDHFRGDKGMKGHCFKSIRAVL